MIEAQLSSVLKASRLDTPLGPMIAAGDEEALHLLEFVDCREPEGWREWAIAPGSAGSIDSIEEELKLYFEGKLKEFKTPLSLVGTPFRKQVWEELRKIPYGKTASYLDLAIAVGKPTGYRAVAQANGANRFAIAIPCHRVINANGALGGYGAGVERKKWLIEHERNV